MPFLAFAQTMACGVTLASTAVDFGFGGARNVSVYIPTMTSGTDVLFKVSYDGTTFRSLKYAPSSGVVAVGNITVGSAVTVAAIRIPELAGSRYIKTEFTSALTATEITFQYVAEY